MKKQQMYLEPDEVEAVTLLREKKRAEDKGELIFTDIEKAADYFMENYNGKYIITHRYNKNDGEDGLYEAVKVNVSRVCLIGALKEGMTKVTSTGKFPITYVWEDKYGYIDKICTYNNNFQNFNFYELNHFWNPYIKPSYFLKKNIAAEDIATEEKPIVKVLPEYKYVDFKNSCAYYLQHQNAMNSLQGRINEHLKIFSK